MEARGGELHPSCLIPWFVGAICSLEWKEALWDKYVTAAHHDTRLKRLCCTNRFEVVLPLKLYIQLPAFALSPTLKQGTSAHA